MNPLIRQTLVSFCIVATFLSSATVVTAKGSSNWDSLNGEQIKLALLDQQLVYPDEGGAIQEFHSNGSTVYIENGPSFGTWRTSVTQYCSVWPPASSWVCYDVFLSKDRTSVRFIGSSGRIYEGIFQP